MVCLLHFWIWVFLISDLKVPNHFCYVCSYQDHRSVHTFRFLALWLLHFSNLSNFPSVNFCVCPSPAVVGLRHSLIYENVLCLNLLGLNNTSYIARITWNAITGWHIVALFFSRGEMMLRFKASIGEVLYHPAIPPNSFVSGTWFPSARLSPFMAPHRFLSICTTVAVQYEIKEPWRSGYVNFFFEIK